MTVSKWWKEHIEHISVSQVKTHDRNPLRWVLEKLEKWPTSTSEAAEIGRRIHQQIEDYLTRDPGHTVALDPPTLAWWEMHQKDPVETLGVEFEFCEKLREHLPPIRGVIDHIVRDQAGHIAVIDHKTSKRGGYFLKAVDLKSDDQMMLYAWIIIRKYKVGRVKLRQNQIKYGLKTPKCTVVETWVCKDRVLKHMEQFAKRINSGIMQTLAAWAEGRIYMLRQTCATSCRNAFGPNSCEFYPKCCQWLTDNNKCDSINTKTNNPIESDMLQLTDLMRQAKESCEGIPNKWDQRDAVVEKCVDLLKGKSDAVVLLPPHFMNSQLDMYYKPVIDWLVENNKTIVIKYS